MNSTRDGSCSVCVCAWGGKTAVGRSEHDIPLRILAPLLQVLQWFFFFSCGCCCCCCNSENIAIAVDKAAISPSNLCETASAASYSADNECSVATCSLKSSSPLPLPLAVVIFCRGELIVGCQMPLVAQRMQWYRRLQRGVGKMECVERCMRWLMLLLFLLVLSRFLCLGDVLGQGVVGQEGRRQESDATTATWVCGIVGMLG